VLGAGHDADSRPAGVIGGGDGGGGGCVCGGGSGRP